MQYPHRTSRRVALLVVCISTSFSDMIITVPLAAGHKFSSKLERPAPSQRQRLHKKKTIRRQKTLSATAECFGDLPKHPARIHDDPKCMRLAIVCFFQYGYHYNIKVLTMKLEANAISCPVFTDYLRFGHDFLFGVIALLPPPLLGINETHIYSSSRRVHHLVYMLQNSTFTPEMRCHSFQVTPSHAY